MEKVDKLYQRFALDMAHLGMPYDHRKFDAIINHLGPSIHNADGALVACSDANETQYIKKEFLIGKLGLSADNPGLDNAIEHVCELMGSDNRHKSRVTFYYLLMVVLNVSFTVLED